MKAEGPAWLLTVSLLCVCVFSGSDMLRLGLRLPRRKHLCKLMAAGRLLTLF